MEASIVRLRLFQGRRRQHIFRALGALARLGRVGLIHNKGEPLTRQLTDFLRYDRKLLERGDDDVLAGFQGVLQLPGGLLNVLHDAQSLFELAHRRL